jgi:hypothetical protein
MYLVGPYDQTVIAGLALREVWDEPLLGKIEANPELRGVRVQTLDEALEFASLWAGAAARLFERSPGWHAAQELPRLGGDIREVRNVRASPVEKETAYSRWLRPPIRFDYAGFKLQCEVLFEWDNTWYPVSTKGRIDWVVGPADAVGEHLRLH